MGINSCLYDCTVTHLRTKPKKNSFRTKLFMFYLDLDEIDSLCAKNFLLGHNRLRMYSFYDQDHMPLSKTTIRENLSEFLKSQGMTAQVGRVMLLANLRTFGYVFNPLAIFFCFDKNDEPLCCVAQITNTFGEIKPYLLKKDALAQGVFKQTHEKLFYISPFSALNMDLEFHCTLPAEKLDIRVDEIQENDKFFYASLTAERRALNLKNLLWRSLCFPLVTFKVIFLIHWHAFLIFLRKLPFYAKEENPHLQKGVYRAWVKN